MYPPPPSRKRVPPQQSPISIANAPRPAPPQSSRFQPTSFTPNQSFGVPAQQIPSPGIPSIPMFSGNPVSPYSAPPGVIPSPISPSSPVGGNNPSPRAISFAPAPPRISGTRKKGEIVRLKSLALFSGGGLKLYEDQERHVEDITHTYTRFNLAISASETGSGKSIIAAHMAKYGLQDPAFPGGSLKFNYLIVIGPAMAGAVWDDVSVKFNMQLNFISRDALRGSSQYKPKSNLVERVDVQTGNKNEAVFYPTPKFKEIVNEGVLLVIDEVHVIKNEDTATSRAINALTSYIVGFFPDAKTARSKVLYTSATPFSERKHALVTMQTLGIGRGNSNLEILESVIQYAYAIDSITVNNIMAMYPNFREHRLTKDEMVFITFEIYAEVIVPATTSSMALNIPDPVINYYRSIVEDSNNPGANAALYTRSIEDLSAQTSGKDNWNIGVVTISLKNLEWSKLLTYWTEIVEKLERRPDIDGNEAHYKVVVTLAFKETGDYLANMLNNTNIYPADGSPPHHVGIRVINGDVNKNTRNRYIEEFQRNDDDVRVLIITQGTGSVAVSFHDTHGADANGIIRPRWSFITTSSNKVIDWIQSVGRVRRRNAQSTSIVVFIYADFIPNGTEGEGAIVNKIITKSFDMKRIIVSPYRETSMFPSDFQVILEDDIKKGNYSVQGVQIADFDGENITLDPEGLKELNILNQSKQGTSSFSTYT